MSAVKNLMMDVEYFVYDFYTKEGKLTDSPKNIIQKAIDKVTEARAIIKIGSENITSLLN